MEATPRLPGRPRETRRLREEKKKEGVEVQERESGEEEGHR